MKITIEKVERMITCYKSNLNKASLLCTSLLDWPPLGWDNWIDRLEALDSDLANKIQFYGIEIWALWNESTSCSGYYQEGLQIDMEEWYLSHKSVQDRWNYLQEEKEGLAMMIRAEIEELKGQCYQKVCDEMEILEISDEMMDELSAEYENL